VVGAVVLAIFGRFWTLEDAVFGADSVVTEDALDDCKPCNWDSTAAAPDDESLDGGTSEDRAESRVEAVAPLSPLGRGEGTLEALAAAVELFLGAVSWPSAPSAS
jgi:hypothetical protein